MIFQNIVNKNGLNGTKSNFIFQLGNYFEQIYKAEMISTTVKFDGRIVLLIQHLF